MLEKEVFVEKEMLLKDGNICFLTATFCPLEDIGLMAKKESFVFIK